MVRLLAFALSVPADDARRHARVRQGHVGPRRARALAEGPDRPASSTGSRSASPRSGASPRRAAAPTGSACSPSATARRRGGPASAAGSRAPATSTPGASPSEQSRELAVLASRSMQLQVNRQDGDRLGRRRRRARSRSHAASGWTADEPTPSDGGDRAPQERARLLVRRARQRRVRQRAQGLVRQGRGVRRRIRRALRRDRSSARCAASSMPGQRRRPAPSRTSSCSTSSRATPFAARARAFAGDAQALAAASAIVGSRQDEALRAVHARLRLPAVRACRRAGDAGRGGPPVHAARGDRRRSSSRCSTTRIGIAR